MFAYVWDLCISSYQLWEEAFLIFVKLWLLKNNEYHQVKIKPFETKKKVMNITLFWSSKVRLED